MDKYFSKTGAAIIYRFTSGSRLQEHSMLCVCWVYERNLKIQNSCTGLMCTNNFNSIGNWGVQNRDA
eukprot:8179249-Pyramimonas_sp.AAC.1